MTGNEKKTEDLGETMQVLFPGTELPLVDAEEKPFATATVYPMSIQHTERFAREIVSAISLIWRSNPDVTVGDDGAVKLSAKERDAFVQMLLPVVLSSAIDLVRVCTRIEPKGIEFGMLPHWCLPDLAVAWIEGSFGSEKKWRVWMGMFEYAIKKMAGEDAEGISGTLSKFFSPPDTTEPTSSTDGSPASRTEDGAIASSAST